MPERKKIDVEELVQKITLAENYAKIDISRGRNTLVDDLAELGSYSRILLRLMKDWAEKEQTTEMNRRMEEIANNIAKRRNDIRMKLRDQVYSAVKTEIMTAVNFIIRLLERSRTSINEQLFRVQTERTLKEADLIHKTVIVRKNGLPYGYTCMSPMDEIQLKSNLPA